MKIKTYDDCYDSYRGQNYCRVYAYDEDTDDILGKIDYWIYDDEIHVSFIEVNEKFRRQGVGDLLLKTLKKIHKGMKINYGMLTADGFLFLKGTGNI